MRSSLDRPFKPVDVHQVGVATFDWHSLAQQLMREDAFVQHGRNSITLVHSRQLTIVLVVAQSGKVIFEEHPSGPASLIVIDGELTLLQPDAKEICVPARTMAALASWDPHAVEVRLPSTFMVIIGTQVTPS